MITSGTAAPSGRLDDAGPDRLPATTGSAIQRAFLLHKAAVFDHLALLSPDDAQYARHAAEAALQLWQFDFPSTRTAPADLRAYVRWQYTAWTVHERPGCDANPLDPTGAA